MVLAVAHCGIDDRSLETDAGEIVGAGGQSAAGDSSVGTARDAAPEASLSCPLSTVSCTIDANGEAVEEGRQASFDVAVIGDAGVIEEGRHASFDVAALGADAPS
ncbi:MAG TPA: hypothetical protein VGL13_00635, partial [Polyangiaceae bacterium]